MPRLGLQILLYTLEGLVLALAFIGLLLWANLANLRHLILNTDDGLWALAIFVVLCSITFGAAQMAIRFVLGDSEED